MPLTVFDTFTGTGTLNDHTADSGGTWYDGYNYSNWYKIELTGSGAAVSELDYTNGYNTIKQAVYGTVMPGVEYYVEVDVSVPAAAEQNTFVGLIARYQQNPSLGTDNEFVETNWWPTSAYFTSGGGLNTSTWGNGAYPASLDLPPASGTHTLRLEVDATESRTYIDGVLKQTTPLEASVPLPGYVGLTICQRIDSTPGVGIEVLEFRAGELTFEPTYFWTNRQRSTETPT